MAKAPAQTPDGFMDVLDHPRKAEAQALRDIILATAPDMPQSLKWNAPSYTVGGEHVLTFDFSDKKSIRLIFHCGPRRKETQGAPPILEDTTGLLEWTSDIRAVVTIRNADDLEHARPLLPGLIQQWMTAVQAG
tara:strand:+ start:889 stop:1290 length:402 start_codon:yes stop_codon:yes gene_type:complete